MAAEIGIDYIIQKLSSFCAVILKTAVSSINVSRETKALLREERGRFELWGDGFSVSEGKLDRLLLGNDQDRQLWESVVIVLLGLASSLRPVMDGIPKTCSGSALDLSNQLSRLLRKVLEILPDSEFLIEPQKKRKFGEEVNWEILIEEIEQSIDSLFDLAPYIDELYSAESHKEELEHEDNEPSMMVETQDYWETVILKMFPKVEQQLASMLAKVQELREHRLSGYQKKYVYDGVSGQRTAGDFGQENVVPGVFKESMGSREVDLNEVVQVVAPKPPVHLSPGTKFRCTICCDMLEHIYNQQDWIEHFLEDTQPFSCLTSSCPEWGTTFGSCKSWLDHEFQHHRYVSEWICVGSCGKTFHTKDDFLAHTLEAHIGGSSPAVGRMLDDIAGNCERRHPPTRKINCPFCQLEIGETRMSFGGHVATHMIQVANAVHGLLTREEDQVFEMEMMKAVCTRDGGERLRLLLSSGGKVTEAVMLKAVSEVCSIEIVEMLLSKGGAITDAVMVKAGDKWGYESGLFGALLDRSSGVTEAVVVGALSKGCRQRPLGALLRKSDEVTEAVMVAAVSHGLDEENLEILLRKGGELSEAVMARAADSRGGGEILRPPLNKGGNVTETMVEARVKRAAGHWNGKASLKSLLSDNNTISITEEMLVIAAGNTKDILEILLNKGGEVTELVMETAAENVAGKGMLELLLSRGGVLTEAVLKKAMGNLSNEGLCELLVSGCAEATEEIMVKVAGMRNSEKTLEFLLSSGGKVTKVVLLAAVRGGGGETLKILLDRGGNVTQELMEEAVSSAGCDEEKLRILLSRGGKVTGTVMKKAASSGRFSGFSGEMLRILLDGGGEVTEVVIAGAADNKSCSNEVLAILLGEGCKVTQRLLEKIASSGRFSVELWRILLDGGGEVTEAVIAGAANNKSCSNEVLAILVGEGCKVTQRLLEKIASSGRFSVELWRILLDRGGEVTEAVIAGAANNKSCSNEMLAILLGEGCKVTQRLMEKIASSGRFSVELWRILLDRGGEVSEAVIAGAAGDGSCSEETLTILLGEGCKVTQRLMEKIASSGRFSVELWRILLDRGGEVSEAVIAGAAGDRSCSEETLTILLDGGGKVTEAVVEKAVSSAGCNGEKLRILLDRGGKVTGAVMKKVVSSRRFSGELWKILLNRGGEVTEAAMVGAAGDRSCSEETLAILLDGGGKVTEAVMKKAVSSRECDEEKLKFLLDRGGKVTGVVMGKAVSSTECDEEKLKVLLDRGGKVTGAVMGRAVSSVGCDGEKLRVLLDRGGKVTGAVMERAATSWSYGGGELRNLHFRGGRLSGYGIEDRKEILRILLGGGGEVTEAVIANVERSEGSKEILEYLQDSARHFAESTPGPSSLRAGGRSDRRRGDEVWGYLFSLSGDNEVIKLGERPPGHGIWHMFLNEARSDNERVQMESLRDGFVVGRYVDCDFVIKEPDISGRHCAIFKDTSEPRDVKVFNLSPNGIRVGDGIVGRNRLQGLRSYDKIEFTSDRRYEFRYPADTSYAIPEIYRPRLL